MSLNTFLPIIRNPFFPRGDVELDPVRKEETFNSSYIEIIMFSFMVI